MDVDEVLSYCFDDREYTIGLATLFLILFWRFGYAVQIETGYDEYLRPEYYIGIFS